MATEIFGWRCVYTLPHNDYHQCFSKRVIFYMKIFRNLIKIDGAKKSPIEQCKAIKLVIVLEFFPRKYPLAKKKKENR